ncbi:MAG: hypothetical protein FWB75_02370 [Oscillospiraceae bacterium]|nr:hypothetical protein [Oscillospiraceae bacterium]
MLTPRERFTRCAFGQDVDKLPVQCDFSASGLQGFLASRGVDRVSDLELLPFFDNHVLYAYMDGVTLRLKTCDYRGEHIIYDEWGNGWDTTQDLMYCTEPLDSWEKLESYTFPDPDAAGYLDYTKRLISEGYARDLIVTSYHFCTLFERAYMLRGFENIMMDMLLESDKANMLLDKITDFHVKLAKRYIKLGVNCGRTVDDYGNQTNLMMSPEIWREFFKPRLKKIHDVYHDAGLPVIHHSCGNITLLMEDFIELGINVLNPVQPAALDVKILSDKYGDKITFFGGICNQTVLPTGTPEEVRAHVKKQTEILGAHGRFVIAPSNGVGKDVPLENVEAFFAAAEQYRQL